jgi:two-component system response regulator HydG
MRVAGKPARSSPTSTLNDLDGLAILEKAREDLPDAEVVMITGHGDVKTAVEAIKRGAANYLMKPVRPRRTSPPSCKKPPNASAWLAAIANAQMQLNERFRLRGSHRP